MTREEFRDKKSKDYRKHRESYGIKDPVYLDEIEEAYYQGMVDADEHPITYDGKAMLYVNSRSHENGYKEAIEKACEWLDEYNRKQTDKMFGTVHTADVTINVADFRKAMESGCSEFPNNSKKGGEE